MSPRRHVVITGTGRAGTTFLVELFTHLGLETGFSADSVAQRKKKNCRAGLEYDIRKKDCPYIVKSPWFCDYADKIIYRDDILIEHIFIPFRDLNAAAESRRYVSKTGALKLNFFKRLLHTIKPKEFAGGLWGARSNEPGKMEYRLLRQIYKLMLVISDTEVPVTLIRYPRLTKDSSYLFNKLKPVIQNITFESFSKTYNDVVRPDLVNSFNKNDR